MPKTLDVKSGELFDPEYMRALYDVRLKEGRALNNWRKSIPGF